MLNHFFCISLGVWKRHAELRWVYEHHITKMVYIKEKTPHHFSTPVSLNAMISKKKQTHPKIANLLSNHRHPYMRRTEAHTEGIQP